MKKILIRATLVGKLSEKELKSYQQTLSNFMNDTHKRGLNLEKLKGTYGEQKIYTIRHNKKSRIALCPIESREGQVWVVTDILANHDYPNLTPLDKDEKNAITSALSDNNNNNNPSVEEIPLVPTSRIEFCNKQFILLDEGQDLVKAKGLTSLPLIISGAPGSGKTSVLLAIIKQNILHWHENKAQSPRILVITKSANLVQQMSREWASIREVEFKDIPNDQNWVEFKTPQELYTARYGVANFKGEVDFIAWYTDYAGKEMQLNASKALPVSVKEAPLIYQELYTMSAYPSLEVYENLVSSKFSLFSDSETRAWLWEIYEKYRENLNKNRGIDLAFHPIDLAYEYDFIGVDETQDLSRQQIKSLVQRQPVPQGLDSAKDNIVFCVGDHQRLFGSETTLPFIRTIFWEKYQKNDVTTHQVLQASYRCPKEIIDVSNAVLQLKYQAIGGVSFLDKKNELVYVQATEGVTQRGAVHWLEHQDDLNPLIQDRDNVHFAVIANPEFMEEAQQLFGRERVYTATSMKGLQAQHVLLYRFLSQEGFKAANSAIGKDFVLQNPPTTVSKASEGSVRHSTVFNEFFVATTRAEVSLSIYQPPLRGIHFITSPLKVFIAKDNHLKTHSQSIPTSSSKEEWLAHAQDLRDNGQEEQAKAIEERFKNNEHSTVFKSEPLPQVNHGVKKKKAKQQPLHPIAEVMLDKPEAVNNLLADAKVKEYLFHTSLKSIDHSWPDCSLVDYFENPEHANVKGKFIEVVKKRLELVCQWMEPTLIQQNQQDSLMGLLYYKPDNKLPFVKPLLNQLKPDTYPRHFMLTFMRDRRNQLEDKLFNEKSLKGQNQVIDSLQCLGLLNTYNAIGDTLVNRAAGAGKTQLIVKLKNLGADINKLSKDGSTAMHMASEKGHLAVVEILINGQAKLNEPAEQGMTPLHLAVQNGHSEVVIALIKAGADPNIANQHGVTALYIAAQKGHVKILEALVSTRAELNKSSEVGATPVFIAAQKGHVQILEVLIRAGARVDEPTKIGVMPLSVASDQGHLEAVKVLIELGKADINAGNNNALTALHFASLKNNVKIIQELIKNPKLEINKPDNNGETALYAAAKNGRIEAIKILLSAGAKVNIANKNGATPFYIAAQNGYVDAMKTLLEVGKLSKVDLHEGCDTFTPLHVAANNGHVETIAFLLSQKVEIHRAAKNGITPLYMAAQQGHLKAVKTLIELGKLSKEEINKSSINGYTPLHIATINGQIKVMEALLSVGAEVNAISKSGANPLHLAAEGGNLEAVTTLIELGNADVNQLSGPATPLHIAVGKAHIPVIAALVKAGADVNMANKKGVPPIYTAAQVGCADAVTILSQSGNLDVNKAMNSLTPLYIAACYGHLPVVEALISAGANVDAVNQDGLTSLYVAAQFGYLDIIKTLVKAGAKINDHGKKELTPLFIAAQHGKGDVVSYLLANDMGAYKPYQSSSKILIQIAEGAGPEAVARAKEFIIRQGQALHAESDLPVLPHEIANIMGHSEIAGLIQDKMATLQNKMPSNPMHRFFSNADNASSDASLCGNSLIT